MCTDDHTNMTKLIVAFHNFADAPTNLYDSGVIKPLMSMRLLYPYASV
jgi:hypothetical protein